LPLSLVARNQAQKIPETPINSRTVVQPSTHYTCPTGKKAILDILVVCTGLGAATQAHLRDPTDTFNLKTWTGAGGTEENATDLQPKFGARLKLELQAGETIKTTQNAGTNAEFNINGTILELPE